MVKWILACAIFSSALLLGGAKEVFSQIYEEAHWGKSEEGIGYSGPGSTLDAAAPFMKFLQKYIKEHKIRSVVDLGCGDWTFSRHFDWGDVKYIGIDAALSVIQRNQKEFSSKNVQFICADASEMELPKADLLICKDVLQHLPNAHILKLLEKFKQYRYCILVNGVDIQTHTSNNPDIHLGEYRFLDLRREPFNLKPNLVDVYDVHQAEGDGFAWSKMIFCIEHAK